MVVTTCDVKHPKRVYIELDTLPAYQLLSKHMTENCTALMYMSVYTDSISLTVFFTYDLSCIPLDLKTNLMKD